MCLYWLVGLYWRLYTLALSLELVLEFLVHLIASLYTLAVVQVMESTGRELRSLASLHLPCPSSSSSLVYADPGQWSFAGISTCWDCPGENPKTNDGVL